jgi:hypothetical protein
MISFNTSTKDAEIWYPKSSFLFHIKVKPKEITLHKRGFKNVIKGLVGGDLHVLAPGKRSGPEDVVAPAQVDPAPLLQLLQGCVASL